MIGFQAAMTDDLVVKWDLNNIQPSAILFAHKNMTDFKSSLMHNTNIAILK